MSVQVNLFEQLESGVELSLEEKCNSILKRAFSLAYEDNPSRTEWPLHDVDSDVVIKRPEHMKGDAYYLIELYLDDELQGKLIDITEGLPCFIDTYKSGRCSLHALLQVYTIENLENRLEEANNIIKKVEQKKSEFIALQEVEA